MYLKISCEYLFEIRKKSLFIKAILTQLEHKNKEKNWLFLNLKETKLIICLLIIKQH